MQGTATAAAAAAAAAGFGLIGLSCSSWWFYRHRVSLRTYLASPLGDDDRLFRWNITVAAVATSTGVAGFSPIGLLGVVGNLYVFGFVLMPWLVGSAFAGHSDDRLPARVWGNSLIVYPVCFLIGRASVIGCFASAMTAIGEACHASPMAVMAGAVLFAAVLGSVLKPSISKRVNADTNAAERVQRRIGFQREPSQPYASALGAQLRRTQR